MDFSKVIKKRHCTRKFDTKKRVDEGQIKKLIKTASLAPSEGNLQPWFFIIIQNQKIKQKLKEATFSQTAIEKASVIIITCIKQDLGSEKYGDRGLNLYSIQSTAVATEHIFLEAINLGLAAFWIGSFNEEKVKNILELEDNLRPVVIMPVGYSSERPFFTKRKNVEEISKFIK